MPDQQQNQGIEQTVVQEVHQVKNMVGELSDTVGRIETLLTGNILDKADTGMIGKVANHEHRLAILEKEERINSLEKRFDKAYWFVAGASALGGYGALRFLETLINNIK